MFFTQKTKSENDNPWFKPWFNILLHTQSIVCATVDSQCLEYLGYITLIFICSIRCEHGKIRTIWKISYNIATVAISSSHMAIVLCGIHSCVGAPSVVCLPWENWHRSDCRRGPLSGHVPSPILYDYVARTKHQLLPATGTMRILQFYAKLYIPSTIKIWRKLPGTTLWTNKNEQISL